MKDLPAVYEASIEASEPYEPERLLMLEYGVNPDVLLERLQKRMGEILPGMVWEASHVSHALPEHGLNWLILVPEDTYNARSERWHYASLRKLKLVC